MKPVDNNPLIPQPQTYAFCSRVDISSDNYTILSNVHSTSFHPYNGAAGIGMTVSQIIGLNGASLVPIAEDVETQANRTLCDMKN